MKVSRNRTAEGNQFATNRTAMATGGAGNRTVTVRVPMELRKRCGRKLVVVPSDGSADAQGQRLAVSEAESQLVKLLARAFYWKRLFESGKYATLAELAAAENVDRSNMSKVLRLTLLAPDIVEAVLGGALESEPSVEELMHCAVKEWGEQKPIGENRRPARRERDHCAETHRQGQRGGG